MVTWFVKSLLVDKKGKRPLHPSVIPPSKKQGHDTDICRGKASCLVHKGYWVDEEQGKKNEQFLHKLSLA